MTVARGRVCTWLVTVALIAIAIAVAFIGSVSRVYGYDAPTVTTANARVELDASAPSGASQAHLSGSPEGSASSSVEARGPSTTRVAPVVATEAGTGASSVVSGQNLGRQLASEQQMGEVGTPIAGAGTSTPLREAERLAEQYGGNASDWSKMGSTSYTGSDGRIFETHWYENDVTGARTEFKTKFPDSTLPGFK